jgi:hypothetical protein
MKLIDYPKNAVDFDLVLDGQGAQLSVPCEQNAAGMMFCQSKRKPIVYRQPRGQPHDGLRAQHTLSRKIDHLQSATHQSSFLSGREFEQLVVKQRVWNQEFARKSEQSVE